MKTISERLKHAMHITGVTSQTELASAAGVSQPTVWKLLRGLTQKPRDLPAIARALGVSLDWLATGSGDMFPGSQLAAPRIDVSRLIPVWDDNGETEDAITSPTGKARKSWRAYVVGRNSGIADAPPGTIVVVDTELDAGTNDIVMARVNQKVSAYRFINGADGTGYLSVDDTRVPMAPASPSDVLGVAVYLVRDLSK
ncbi:helix-turn-helix domain-containing protein [Salmonella enterica]